jgi:hypothetical protein
MKALYITSVVTFSGKTAICLGLGLHAQNKGHKVGYFKPLSMQGYRVGDQIVDEDAEFVRRVLQLETTAADISPLVVTESLMQSVLDGKADTEELWKRVEAAYDTAAQNKDLVLLEGGASMRDGFAIGLNTIGVVRRLDVPALSVVRWRPEANLLDDIMATKHRLQERLFGVILNSIPETQWDYMKNKMAPYLEKEGIPVYGVLPHQQQLMAISVGELANLLDAEILTGENAQSRLVENLSVGAMTVEAALPLFRRQVNKAVITGGDRTDIQAAALETSTVCLILTGNLQPSATVLRRAEETGIAVLLVSSPTIDAVEKIEGVFGKTRLGQAEKLNRFQAMLAEHLEYDRLLSDLGV